MDANPCRITAGIVPAINYYIILPYVGSYIPSAIASGWLLTPASGVAPSILALLCGNRFGAPRLTRRTLYSSIYSPMLSCITCEHVNLSRDTLCMIPVPLMLLCHE